MIEAWKKRQWCDGDRSSCINLPALPFDLKKLAEGVASIPVPGEKSNHQIRADRNHDRLIQ
jgi:hypothetical protein